MADPCAVCVVIPCFNREDTVAEAVKSVLDQDQPAMEVIAVDDNSTDRTLEVLREIDDPRLRVVRNPGRGGPSSTRNYGAGLSDAPWIAFQDSDDLWLPGRLSRQMARLAEGDFVAAYCGMQVKADTDPSTPVTRVVPDRIANRPLEGDIRQSLARTSFISTQMLTLRRDVFDRAGGFDEDLPALEDWDLMLRIAQIGPVAFVDDDLVVQRMSGNSITRSNSKRLTAQARIIVKHADLLAGYPDVLAHHHHRLAGGYRLAGDHSKAADHAFAAFRTKPGNVKYLGNALYLRARSLLA